MKPIAGMDQVICYEMVFMWQRKGAERSEKGVGVARNSRKADGCFGQEAAGLHSK